MNSPAATSAGCAAIAHVEIPVRDLARAMRFYETVFGLRFETEDIDGNAMAHAVLSPDVPGASLSLAHGDSYVPSLDGPRPYFRVPSAADALARAISAGGRELYPVTDVGAYGRVAEFEDSEGNCIALHEPRR